MSQIALLPLFPLNAVLFPGGLLPLRIFEPRYMDMIAECLRLKTTFGVCLIVAGSETGEAAVPHTVGTEARVLAADADSIDEVNIVVVGERRFRLRDHSVDGLQLLSGEVDWLPPIAPRPVPAAQANLIPLLERIVRDLGERIPAPHRFDDAEWVGARYAEVLPISLLARQKLLELDDVISRLEIIQQYLDQRDLLTPPGVA
ncbi:LON peptidase substrate-binding domain-containing protein [Denitromonas iodatirespirans]|uniref:LON peptidase substrate-binding domain-containing protein n=1 Tax=Denitromonas iodatirespirans TaxID=2795389 RepID=A0A944D588_DENI1|nr:LON peptidase substrate-binding domain-containing protein [Denitromonas iodatirespirans]MBT0960095.1 LON peptidase substrate-binding domain-containing protein [Denitromonas iodatirespirans]